MSPQESKLLLTILKGNLDAAAFCEEVIHAAHFWDDLIDRDRPLDDDRINAAMWRVLVELPRNRFYRKHFDTLNPVLMVAATNWITATKFEREQGACLDKLATAYVLRSSYVNVLVVSAILVGGAGYGIAMEPALREYFHRGESYLQYRKNLRTESAAREKTDVSG